MAEVRVRKVDPGSSIERHGKRKLYATLCYYYPQYTLQQAACLPARDITLLVKTAEKLQARQMYDMTQIIASPHTKNGVGVKQLLKHFKDRMND